MNDIEIERFKVEIDRRDVTIACLVLLVKGVETPCRTNCRKG